MSLEKTQKSSLYYQNIQEKKEKKLNKVQVKDLIQEKKRVHTIRCCKICVLQIEKTISDRRLLKF